MTFAQMLEQTLQFEGGRSNHKQDRGNETQYGITQNTLNAYLAQRKQQSSNTYTDFPQDVTALTLEEVTQIYYEVFYIKPRLALLPNVLQPVVFDMAVNHGPKRAIKILQHVMNASGLVSIEADGVCRSITAKSAELCYAQMGILLVNAICDERSAFYERIVACDRTQQVFQKGWQHRAEAFKLTGNVPYEAVS